MALLGTKTFQNYIGGEWVDAASGKWGEDRSPARPAEVLALFAQGGEEDVKAAVAAAKAALPAWRQTPAPRRADFLWKALRRFDERQAEVAEALCAEEGKTLSEALGEVKKALAILEYIAGEGRRLSGETAPSELPSTFCYTVREPVGVVAIVTPWNFPFAIPMWKIAPALVAGNTVVFKPASLTPMCAELLVRTFADAGLPRGVLNLVMGPGGPVGDTLTVHPDVAAVSFTGSNEVGTRLHTRAAALGKKVQCEMGGKNPVIVLEDADLDLAAIAIAQGAFGSSGQRCTATSRAIVARPVAAELTRKVIALAQAMVAGDPRRPGTTLGPLVDEKQLQTVLRYVDVARGEGAHLATGGERLRPPGCEDGWYVAPTIFTGVRPEMRIAQEEVFGPVLAIIEVDDLDEALRVANGVKYGLSSSIYTRDLESVFRFIDRIETGITHVNSPTMGGEAQLPFGGTKATGVGMREMGKTAIDFYSE